MTVALETADKKSAATKLVDLAVARYSFGVSKDGEPFAVPRQGEKVARLLRGGKRGLRAELAREYFRLTQNAAPSSALTDAMMVIEGMATEADPEPLAQRVAVVGADWWLDLGDATGRAVRITPSGWNVAAPPIRFRRTVLTSALPEPASGGALEELWGLLNVGAADRPLVVSWLVSSLIETCPTPILNLEGEQGSGKSTAARILSSLIDPSPVPVRKAPRDPEAWIVAAQGSWVVALDNLSGVPDWLSDTLCRAVTGDGDVRRRLYTDGELALFAFRRAVLLNGIDLGAVRGDLADRLLVVTLDRITETHRRLDAEVHARWADAHPRVLGALLDLAASVASVLPSIDLVSSPRMADFAKVLAAVDKVLGTAGFDRYLNRATTLAMDTLTADPFVVAMATRLAEDGSFLGTSAELLALVNGDPDARVPKGWPASARALTTLLKRQAPVMRRAGWTVTDHPPGHDNAIRWAITSPSNFARIQDSRYSQDSQRSANASVASVASVDPPLSTSDGVGVCGHSLASIHTGNGKCGECIADAIAARSLAVVAS